jgi:hypothetical protein
MLQQGLHVVIAASIQTGIWHDLIEMIRSPTLTRTWRLVQTRSIYMVLRNHAAPCAHEQFLVLQASLIPSVQFSRVLYSLLVLFASQAWPSQVAEPP